MLASASLENKEISGIGLSGQMQGLALLNKDNNVLRPAQYYGVIKEQKEECDYLNNVIGREGLTAYTGNMELSGFTLSKVLWIKKNEPEILGKTAYMMLPKEYIRFKPTGEMATEVSGASVTLMKKREIDHKSFYNFSK